MLVDINLTTVTGYLLYAPYDSHNNLRLLPKQHQTTGHYKGEVLFSRWDRNWVFVQYLFNSGLGNVQVCSAQSYTCHLLTNVYVMKLNPKGPTESQHRKRGMKLAVQRVRTHGSYWICHGFTYNLGYSIIAVSIFCQHIIQQNASCCQESVVWCFKAVQYSLYREFLFS
jgi:hypothetical protein